MAFLIRKQTKSLQANPKVGGPIRGPELKLVLGPQEEMGRCRNRSVGKSLKTSSLRKTMVMNISEHPEILIGINNGTSLPHPR